ncbi:zinc finger CCHC domain-containing protein 12-like [Nothobranchius furzeri]|uniref:zinc finger CCHC domain-containing protein 12-like n=1 Tax=Nothobranchius furzeri TaxID=105023 RepID=UPI0039048FAD
MEVVKTEKVKVSNAVLISGLTDTDLDNEVFGFMEGFGPVNRRIKLPNCDQIIVEFQHEATVKELKKQCLPYDKPCTRNPDVFFHIQDLASAYSLETSTSATDAYLSELRDIAARSNQSFKDLLMEELAKIGESIGRDTHASEPVTEPEPMLHSDQVTYSLPLTPEVNYMNNSKDNCPPTETGKQNPCIPPNLLNTPEVQRVIVEHIVKSSEVIPPPTSQYRLKPFSGRVPHPSFETDYDTWRSSVVLCINDPSLTKSQIVRRIVESLSAPAASIVKALSPKSDPETYLEHLDSAYAAVEDGDELFARFLNTNQDSGEKPSDYFQRLYTLLNLVIQRNGISSSDADQQLLKQFCRGCWDSSLISNLQLEQKKDNPPHFTALLLKLRTEEDKQATKAARMKQHLGAQRTRVYSNVQTTCSQSKNTCELEIDDNCDDLRKQIAELRSQIAQLKVNNTDKKAKKTQKESKPRVGTKIPDEPKQIQQITAVVPRPKPGYCFKCGEDGHIASSCSNEPNPALVATKRLALRQKQREWEMSKPIAQSPPLNR